MSRHRVATLAMVSLLLAATGCGGGETATTTTPASTTATSAATTTTAAPATSVAPTTTTTTMQATTTTSDEHPAWDVGWAALWPNDGATASYRVNLWGGGTVDLPARIEYGVQWQDGTWDCLTLGEVVPGEWGVALYFQRPEPWVLRIWGLEVTAPGQGPGGSMLEYSEEPGILDLRTLPEGEATIYAGVVFGGGGVEPSEPMSGTYSLAVVGLETIEVAAGTLEDTLHLQLPLGGEFFGAADPDAYTESPDIWIQPGQLLVKWGRPAPGFESFELLTLWE
ncbi:MAG: hypothetical protein JW785_10210 [Acidimicrobiia bacterium]|nr:hypothetical protein [Acidimicrobiia bacterium]